MADLGDHDGPIRVITSPIPVIMIVRSERSRSAVACRHAVLMGDGHAFRRRHRPPALRRGNTIDLDKAAARGLRDSLYLVHAFHMEMAAYGDAMMAIPGIINDARQAASKQLGDPRGGLSAHDSTVPGAV
jgi:hypothetical protein